jgi:nucleotide-binding universal stress UspA family protein
VKGRVRRLGRSLAADGGHEGGGSLNTAAPDLTSPAAESRDTLIRRTKMPGIIVGIDGSNHSRRALEWAIKEAAVKHTPLTVLTVQQAMAGYWGPVVYPDDPNLTEQTRKVAQEETDIALAELGTDFRPPSVSIVVRFGLPAEEILEAAQDADMIVVGSRGAGGFRKLLMGSVSSQVTHHASCPVVVIPNSPGARS